MVAGTIEQINAIISNIHRDRGENLATAASYCMQYQVSERHRRSAVLHLDFDRDVITKRDDKRHTVLTRSRLVSNGSDGERP